MRFVTGSHKRECISPVQFILKATSGGVEAQKYSSESQIKLYSVERTRTQVKFQVLNCVVCDLLHMNTLISAKFGTIRLSSHEKD